MTRLALILLHLVIGASAIGAGQALVLKPSGEALTFETEWLENSPFPDYRVPGLFLLLVIAPTNLISAVAQIKKHRSAPLLSTGNGTLLVLWVSIQTVIIGFQHWSQTIWFVLFPLTTVLGFMQLRQKRSE